jgi:hypothetical protein
LAAAGISLESQVDIPVEKGRLVIQLPECKKEQLFDKLLAEIPDAEEVLAMVRKSLSDYFLMTDETTKNFNALCDKLEQT